MSSAWRSAAIVKSEALTPAVRRIVLSTEEPLHFHAGQYLHLRDHRGFESPFSIASPPRAENLEFLLSSSAIHDAVFRRVGETIQYSGPFGSLSLAPNAPGHIFAAIGTGIAPIRSMILDRWGLPAPPPACLLLGHRSRTELPFLTEFTELSERVPTFRFHPLASREASVGIPKQRVTDALLGLIPERPGWMVYLCGRPEFVTEARASLRELGVSSEEIRADYSL